MVRSEFISKLNYFEDKYDVQDWVVNGYHIWPILKLYIFFSIFRLKYNEVSKKESTYIKLYRLIHSFFSFFKLVFLKKRKKKHVMFSGANNYRVSYQNKFVNRFYFPFYKICKDNNTPFVTVDFDRRDKTKEYQERKNIFFLKDYTYITYFFRKFRFKKNHPNELLNFDSFVTELNIALNSNFDEKKLINLLHQKTEEINNYKYVYNIFIKKFNVDLGIGICYYSLPMFAFHNLCNDLGIKSIDYQHGTQGDSHVSYTGFYKEFKDKLSLLPKAFWVWDEPSAANLEKWVAINNKEVLRGGNSWLQYLTKNDKNMGADLSPNKKIILYTMQFDFLDKEIIDAIKLAGNDYVWWLRLHPRKTHIIDELEKLLEKEGLKDRVEIKKATELPLIQILSSTFVHISKFSGSIIEAEQCGVSSIIIDVIGLEAFKEYVEKGNCMYLSNFTAINLHQAIQDITNKRKSVEVSELFDYKQIFTNLITGHSLI